MLLLASGLSGAGELRIACFNHFTSFFQAFRRPAGEVVSIEKMSSYEIIRQLEHGDLRIAITDHLPEHPERFHISPLAVTGILVAVNAENPLKDIRLETAHRLLDAEIPNWYGLNGKRAAVRVYRPANTVMQASFSPCGHCKEKERKDPSPVRKSPALILQTENNARSFSLLFVDPDGVTALPLTSWKEKRVKLLSIDGTAPTLASIESGKYPFAKKIWLITPNGNMTEAERLLVAYIKSRSFAEKLYADGCLPFKGDERDQ